MLNSLLTYRAIAILRVMDTYEPVSLPSNVDGHKIGSITVETTRQDFLNRREQFQREEALPLLSSIATSQSAF